MVFSGKGSPQLRVLNLDTPQAHVTDSTTHDDSSHTQDTSGSSYIRVKESGEVISGQIGSSHRLQGCQVQDQDDSGRCTSAS